MLVFKILSEITYDERELSISKTEWTTIEEVE